MVVFGGSSAAESGDTNVGNNGPSKAAAPSGVGTCGGFRDVVGARDDDVRGSSGLITSDDELDVDGPFGGFGTGLGGFDRVAAGFVGTGAFGGAGSIAGTGCLLGSLQRTWPTIG